MDAMGANLGRVIYQYSLQFKSDFLNLLRLNHGEKSVHVNRFYQEYIADPGHVHLNATRWHRLGLTRFAKWLGRQGMCRVDERKDGLYIAWIDDSSETLQRAAALDKKERAEAAGRRQEERQLEKQVKRAHARAKHSGPPFLPHPKPLGPTKTSADTIKFQFGEKTHSTPQESILQPRKTSAVFKAAGRKRGRPVDEDSEAAEPPTFKHRATDRERA